jgi:hypothetical protein
MEKYSFVETTNRRRNEVSSEANFSTNVRLGPSGMQLTVRGDSSEEFQTHVLEAVAAIPTLLALEEAARTAGDTNRGQEAQAVATVVNAFNGTVVAAPAATTPAFTPPPAAAPQGFAPVAPAAAPQGYAPPQYQPSTAQEPGPAPTCEHGPMKLVPGGISKKNNKPYNAFWACQWPNRDEQCKAQF